MSTFPKLPDQLPVCRKCGKEVMLVRIAPQGIRQGIRTFECPRCEHVEEVLVPPKPRLKPTHWGALETPGTRAQDKQPSQESLPASSGGDHSR
jgi:DNA-directed RNA polymerase subunit RPC12/RpoP